MTREELGIVWLCGCTELDKRECAALLRAAGSPARLLDDYEKIVPSVIRSPKSGLYKERGLRLDGVEKLLRELERESVFPITVLDEDYPEALKNIASPPLLLYGKGNRALLKERKFCIVGSRVTPPWAESLGRAISAELSSRFCIVTGLAEGGDSAAIAGALPFKNLISVLPCGIFGCYPASHAGLKEQIAKSGLLLSEYPPDEGVKKYSFHERNRLLAGLAEGGDSAAIQGALPAGKVISVLPCGLKECYPASHAGLKERIAGSGLLLSEYPLGEPVKKYSFHERNRLLAGLSEGVLVLSAGAKSGALITANCAAEFGRDVFALPYRPNEARGAGCNDLIKKGASLVTETEDILSFYGLEEAPVREEGTEEKGPSLTPEEARVYEVLRDGGELHTSVLAEKAGLRVFEVAAVLSSLELKGLAVKAGGNRYSIAR